MDIDQLNARFAEENACREFFESVIWQNGRRCPHCGCQSFCLLFGRSCRPGLYKCSGCNRQFTVTTKTRMHNTKLPLWKWLLCMYLMVNPSKGVSSVFVGKWLAVAQRTAWKMGHAIRRLMEPDPEGRPLLNGIVELDEKYFGGKPRYYEKAITHKRGKGTEKQGVLLAAERQSQVRSALIASDQTAELRALVEGFVDQQAHLMADQKRLCGPLLGKPQREIVCTR